MNLKNIFMKNKRNQLFGIMAIAIAFCSCKKDENPSIDDHPLNYTIPEVPVSTDIPVGAYLYTTSNIVNDNIRWTRLTETYDVSTGKIGPYVKPELDRYTLGATDEGVYNMTKIVEWAKVGKIDFLISPAVKENPNALYPMNINKEDSLLVNQLGEHPSELASVKMGTLKYAISLDLNNFCGGLSNNLLLENAPAITVSGTTLTREQRLYNYMKRISDYFNDETYYHTNGKPVLVFIGAERLYTADSRKIYDNIRALIKEHTGKDVYIIARQQQWTPSARFEYFFMRGKVDAVTMDNMCNVGGGQWDRTYLLNRLINENFKINKEYMATNYGVDFIPSASPSFNNYISSAATPDYNYPAIYKKDSDFKERCNVAKMNLGTNKMVLIESFNNWMYDSQIEPTVTDYGNGYGTQYLDIVRQQFKVK